MDTKVILYNESNILWHSSENECLFLSFRCGMDYHAPTDCNTIKKWLTKCADDSETANYISAHTKDVSVLYCVEGQVHKLPRDREMLDCDRINILHFAVSEVSHLHREERRLQPHAVLQL